MGAKVGYLNVRDRSLGREVRTIAVDPDRAPYITLAFELFATGDYTLPRLVRALAERGLRTRGDGRNPSAPVSHSQLGAILRDRYYLGYVNYQGEEFRGRHEPLVTPELFARVQAVLDSHSGSGERTRNHRHYLKGTLWCGRCHERGRESRLTLQRTLNRHGAEYLYFFCIARQDHLCDAPYIQVDDVEAAVLRHYGSLVLPAGFAETIRRELDETLADEERGARLLRGRLSARLSALNSKEENLLDLGADGTLATAKVRERLRAIAGEREQLQAELERGDDQLQPGAAVIRQALSCLRTPRSCIDRPVQPCAADSTRRSSTSSTSTDHP